METTLADIARARAADRSDHVAFACGPAALTYAELDRQADAVARRLAGDGLGPGDRVGYLARNHLGYPVVAVAASRLGAIGVGLNWRLPASELAGVLADAEPHTVFADDEFAAPLAAAVGGLSGPAPRVVTVAADPAVLAAWAAGASADSAPAGPAPADSAPADALWAPAPSDVAQIVYTSGTTGQPKGVMTTNGALLEHLRTPPPWTLGPDATVLIVSPVFHAVGVVWTAFVVAAGATGIFVADPDPASVLAEVERRRVTHTVWVPALLQAIVDHPDAATRDLTSLEVVIYGASPISERLLEQCFAQLPGCRFVQGYGMTETTGPVTYLPADEHVPGSPLLRTAGRAAPNCAVRVVDLTAGTPAAPGAPGEVQTASSQCAVGYWRNPTATAELFTPDGWLRTGDVGTIDEEGYLTLTDRVKDVIVSGGENVYSGEVERVLLTLPGVAEACVIGAPSDRWGETVTAVVVVRPGAEAPDEPAIIAHCRERLAHYKCPTAVHFADSLPRNPSGKVLRRLVRAPFWPA